MLKNKVSMVLVQSRPSKTNKAQHTYVCIYRGNQNSMFRLVNSLIKPKITFKVLIFKNAEVFK